MQSRGFTHKIGALVAQNLFQKNHPFFFLKRSMHLQTLIACEIVDLMICWFSPFLLRLKICFPHRIGMQFGIRLAKFFKNLLRVMNVFLFGMWISRVKISCITCKANPSVRPFSKFKSSTRPENLKQTNISSNVALGVCNLCEKFLKINVKTNWYSSKIGFFFNTDLAKVSTKKRT